MGDATATDGRDAGTKTWARAMGGGDYVRDGAVRGGVEVRRTRDGTRMGLNRIDWGMNPCAANATGRGGKETVGPGDGRD